MVVGSRLVRVCVSMLSVVVDGSCLMWLRLSMVLSFELVVGLIGVGLIGVVLSRFSCLVNMVEVLCVMIFVFVCVVMSVVLFWIS